MVHLIFFFFGRSHFWSLQLLFSCPSTLVKCVLQSDTNLLHVLHQHLKHLFQNLLMVFVLWLLALLSLANISTSHGFIWPSHLSLSSLSFSVMEATCMMAHTISLSSPSALVYLSIFIWAVWSSCYSLFLIGQRSDLYITAALIMILCTLLFLVSLV